MHFARHLHYFLIFSIPLFVQNNQKNKCPLAADARGFGREKLLRVSAAGKQIVFSWEKGGVLRFFVPRSLALLFLARKSAFR